MKELTIEKAENGYVLSWQEEVKDAEHFGEYYDKWREYNLKIEKGTMQKK